MIELYGNKIWNSNTPNKYKKVIIANEDSFDNICQELENSGLNYCAYIFNGEAHIAIGRATATNIDKLDIDYQTVIECNSKVYKTNNIIGTTTYDSIEDKLYRKYNTDFAYKIGQRLTEQGILFSGRIYGKTTTITVDEQYADTLNKISAELKEQRASFMSKSEIVQNESPEESKSVNEKISELHFNESQLSALAPSVKFIQTRNDDNLTDNFVSLFSDCTDFYESQLSALAEIYVDTYRSFSDKSLMFADTSRFNDLKQRFVNDNITEKLTENRGYSTTQFEIIREMVTYGMSESVINLLDYTFSIDEMQNFFTAYKNGSYEDLINLIADIKGTTRTDIEGQIEGGTYTPALPDFNTLEKTLYFQESEVESITYMYYNPDAYSGGQFVITEVSYKQIAEANKEYGDDFSGFFDFLDTTGEQRLIDIGSESFRTAVKKFYSGTEFAEGLNADIQHKLVELAVVPEIKLPEVRKIELIKVGDFYEVRGENAKAVADILDLVSTTRNINGSSVDTVGFPDFKLNDNTELLKTQGFTVNIKYEELAPFYEEHDELDDIDPAVIRQQLEDAGIVNGELVDEDKLNSDPFIQQVMTDKAPARKCADVDQAALSYGEIKALCTGDDRIREKLTLDNRVKELNSLKADYNNTKYELEDAVAAYPEKRKQLLCTIGNIKSDIDNVKSFVDKDGKLICKLTLGSQTFNLKNDEERKNAAKALTTAVAQVRIADNRKKQVSVGNICGFDISVINNGNVYDDIVVTIKGKYSYSAQLGVSAVHNLSKIEGLLYKTESVLDYSQNSLNKLDLDYKTSVALLEKPFEYEAELQEKSARLSELTKILNIELAHQKTESKPKTHYFGKDKILGRNKSSKQIQNKTVMKSEPKRSEPEL